MYLSFHGPLSLLNLYVHFPLLTSLRDFFIFTNPSSGVLLPQQNRSYPCEDGEPFYNSRSLQIFTPSLFLFFVFFIPSLQLRRIQLPEPEILLTSSLVNETYPYPFLDSYTLRLSTKPLQ